MTCLFVTISPFGSTMNPLPTIRGGGVSVGGEAAEFAGAGVDAGMIVILTTAGNTRATSSGVACGTSLVDEGQADASSKHATATDSNICRNHKV
jgi:formylmethanofuran dehydrogenase subunit C